MPPSGNVRTQCPHYYQTPAAAKSLHLALANAYFVTESPKSQLCLAELQPSGKPIAPSFRPIPPICFPFDVLQAGCQDCFIRSVVGITIRACAKLSALGLSIGREDSSRLPDWTCRLLDAEFTAQSHGLPCHSPV